MYADVAWGYRRESGDSARTGLDIQPRKPSNIGYAMGALIRVSLACVAALAGIVLTEVPATAQGTVKSVHGDRPIRWDTPPGARAKQCARIQTVPAEARPNVGVTVMVRKAAD